MRVKEYTEKNVMGDELKCRDIYIKDFSEIDVVVDRYVFRNQDYYRESLREELRDSGKGIIVHHSAGGWYTRVFLEEAIKQ